MELTELKDLIAGGETLHVEFKGEEKNPLNDTDLVDAVVCLANGEGGCLIVGVEDDGRVTGAKNRHGTGIDCGRVTALIRSRTTPAIEASVSTIPTDNGQILVIEVPHASVVVSSSRGLCVRRVRGQFQIFYKWGHDQHEYQPDFVAETKEAITMLEPKARGDMEDPQVVAKKEAAIRWCQHASDHNKANGGKPWKYLLIPHDAIAENMTIDGLAGQFALIH